MCAHVCLCVCEREREREEKNLLECSADGKPRSWAEPGVAREIDFAGAGIEFHHLTECNGPL